MPRSAKGKKFVSVAIDKAVEVLQDPRVRREILKNGKEVIDSIQRWAPFVNDHADSVTKRFGQKGLERRVENARSVVAAVSSKSPELASNLRPVTESLDEVGYMLNVAAHFPFIKRKRAHMKIDAVLDKLEAGLFDATMGEYPEP